MSCYHPLRGYQSSAGGPVFFSLPSKAARMVVLPCGQCIGCRLERSRQWAIRCVHEASMHSDNCFVTLTYDDEHVPSDLSLRYRDFQLFAKRLRRRVGPFRFYMCGEYGDITSRPHFHACVFGFCPADKVFSRRSSDGSKLYTSELLSDVWSNGFTLVGEVTFESAAYVARYCLKVADKDLPMREILNVETGEIDRRVHEFSKMSLRPGVGATWLAKYKSDVYPLDRVIMRGKACKPPRYYDQICDVEDVGALYRVKERRRLAADKQLDDNTVPRLRVKETVHKARAALLKRSLDKDT